jgi:hypothetical protein
LPAGGSGSYFFQLVERWWLAAHKLGSISRGVAWGPAEDQSRSLIMAFYELRQYVIREGKMEAWLKCMEEEIIPFQIAKGMVITGSYRGETDNSVYVWTRRFESEEERERLYKAVYESDHWKNNISPKVGELIDRSQIKVQRIVPTRLSTSQ